LVAARLVLSSIGTKGSGDGSPRPADDFASSGLSVPRRDACSNQGVETAGDGLVAFAGGVLVGERGDALLSIPDRSTRPSLEPRGSVSGHAYRADDRSSLLWTEESSV